MGGSCGHPASGEMQTLEDSKISREGGVGGLGGIVSEKRRKNCKKMKEGKRKRKMPPCATGVPGFGFAKVSGGGMICSVGGTGDGMG